MKNLLKFCHDNNIYEKIQYNVRHPQWEEDCLFDCNSQYYKEKCHSILCGVEKASEFFGFAFLWEATNEGHRFWSDINAKWNSYCLRHHIEYIKR